MFQYPYTKDVGGISINDKIIIGLKKIISEMEDLINKNKNNFSISETYFDEIMKELYNQNSLQKLNTFSNV